MIRINIPMPDRCKKCPCYDDPVYGHCKAADIWLDAKDGAWFSEKRPSWCPMAEDNIGIFIRDKSTNTIHRFGTDPHDSFWVDSWGTLHYSNLQNGDGCGARSVKDEDAGYEFCPMLYGEIDPDYLEEHKPIVSE